MFWQNFQTDNTGKRCVLTEEARGDHRTSGQQRGRQEHEQQRRQVHVAMFWVGQCRGCFTPGRAQRNLLISLCMRRTTPRDIGLCPFLGSVGHPLPHSTCLPRNIFRATVTRENEISPFFGLSRFYRCTKWATLSGRLKSNFFEGPQGLILPITENDACPE